MVYDVAIIGSGPAGISAALNLKIHNKSFIWFGCNKLSEKVEKAEMVRNYPGLSSISGKDLQKAYYKQLYDMGISIAEEVVTSIFDMGNSFTILAKEKQYEASYIIMASGVETLKSIDGESDFLGAGLSYCATCDGLLYKDKIIGVLCTNKEFEHEIEYLCGIASKVFMIPLYKNYEIKASNAEIIQDMPMRIEGNNKVEQLVFKNRTLSIDGMFILKNSISPTVLLQGIETDGGHIVVDRCMKTSIERVYAAGDCTGRPYQYAKAIGEGNVAAYSIIRNLK